MRLFYKKQLGFTIAELLIVIVVIGILAAITIVAYNGIQTRARGAAASSALTQASKKIVVAMNDGTLSTYPANQTAFDALGINSNGVDYQYKITSTGYCITATTGNVSYKLTENSSPTAGQCLGHAGGGAQTITNLIANPGFESGTGGWTDNGGRPIAQSTIGVTSSSRSLFVTNNSGGVYSLFPRLMSGILANPNDVLTAMGTVRVEVVAQSKVYLRIDWLNSSSGVISTAYSTTESLAVGATTTLRVTGTAPAATVGARIGFLSENVTNGAVFYIDSVMLTKSATMYNYADGNSEGWDWTGTANNSTSTGPPV